MNDQYPFNVPLIFIRTARMTNYRGLSGGDRPIGGGGYVDENGYGEEIFNFQPFQGRVYGGCRPPGGRSGETDGRINLANLGGTPGATCVSGVIVVWVATHKNDGAKIVGWYSKATVYADWQAPPIGSNRTVDKNVCGYYVTAREKDARLLSPEERKFEVPQRVDGGMWRPNVWYAKDRGWHRDYRDRVLKLVTAGKEF